MGIKLLVLLLALVVRGDAQVRKGERVEIRSDERIDGDVFLKGEQVSIKGTVNGDVFVTGKYVDVDGHVTGDVISFGRTVDVHGRVDGSIISLGNTVEIFGTVGRSIRFVGDTVRVDSSANIGGLMVMSDSLDVDGRIARGILFRGKRGNIGGTVAGGIDAKGHELILAGEVDGPVQFVGDAPPTVLAGAHLKSPPSYRRLEHKRTHSRHYYVWQAIWMAALTLSGLVLLVLMPRLAGEGVRNAERFGPSFGLGVFVLFGVPIVALVACLTVVGLFLGLSTFLLWCACLFASQIIVGAFVGQILLGRSANVWPLVGRMAVGIVIARLCTLIPDIGGWIKFGVILWGVGAISLALYNRVQPRFAAAQ